MTASTTAIQLTSVTASYGGPPALSNVTLTIPTGQTVGIIGPNGCGKSTLFRLILGLLPPQSGQVTVLGGPPTSTHRRRHPIGYVPQARPVGDFPITVEQMVLTGRHGQIGFFRRPGPADHAAVTAALATVGLLDQRHRPIGALSGGQRQRAYLARALAQEPALLLLDEPLTGLDLPSQEAIYATLADRRAAGVTILVTTHDLAALDDFGFDRLVCINGRVVADGPPQAVITESALATTYGGLVTTLRRLLTEVS